MRPSKNFWRDERGTTAIEFAILAPVFISLIIGTLYFCELLFLVGSLHFAVEDGARCASVKTTVCTNSATTIAYTQTRYLGPFVSPTFTYTTPACGKSVSASVNYVFDFGLSRVTLPLSATACFP